MTDLKREDISLQTMSLSLRFSGYGSKEIIIIIQPLFTLGSVYSTSASGAEQTIETNNLNIT